MERILSDPSNFFTTDGPHGDRQETSYKKSSREIVDRLENENWIPTMNNIKSDNTWIMKLHHICVGKQTEWSIAEFFYIK